MICIEQKIGPFEGCCKDCVKIKSMCMPCGEKFWRASLSLLSKLISEAVVVLPEPNPNHRSGAPCPGCKKQGTTGMCNHCWFQSMYVQKKCVEAARYEAEAKKAAESTAAAVLSRHSSSAAAAASAPAPTTSAAASAAPSAARPPPSSILKKQAREKPEPEPEKRPEKKQKVSASARAPRAQLATAPIRKPIPGMVRSPVRSDSSTDDDDSTVPPPPIARKKVFFGPLPAREPKPIPSSEESSPNDEESTGAVGSDGDKNKWTHCRGCKTKIAGRVPYKDDEDYCSAKCAEKHKLKLKEEEQKTRRRRKRRTLTSKRSLRLSPFPPPPPNRIPNRRRRPNPLRKPTQKRK
jgi:hypothetical protein